jgi:hypothetical protein
MLTEESQPLGMMTQPHLFHVPLDNEPPMSCFKASMAYTISEPAEGLCRDGDA